MNIGDVANDAVRTAGAEARPSGGTPVVADLRADARLAVPHPRAPSDRLRDLSSAAAGAAHVVLFALIVFLSRSPPVAEPQETSVEVVQEAPPAKSDEGKAGGGPSADKAADIPAQEAAKAKPVDAKPVDAKPEQAAHEEPRMPQPSSRTAAVEPPKPPSQPSRPPAPAGTSPAPSAQAIAQLQNLQQELALLKAQQADLKAQAQAQAEEQAAAAAEAQAQTRVAAADSTKALGLLPESFSAVALPPVTSNGQDPVTYEQAVYTLVNKAKRTDRTYMAGVAHVVFDIDAKGGLVGVTVDHSSGNAAVDAEAVALIRRAAPFPPPPNGAPRTFPAYMSFVADH